MQYRNFGKLDWQVSALGFGAMRLPTTEPNPWGQVNEAEAVRILRHAIDEGVNYLDTAYVYHGGSSEVAVGKALRDGYRKKVRVATKSPVWMIQGAGDFDRYLGEQLGRLEIDAIDFYLLHSLNRKTWRNVVLQYGLLEKAEAAMRDGRIRYLGFSFHDEPDAFVEILNGYDRWTFCQIQYNYLDTENQAGTKGLKLAAEKGLAVVIMEPLLGGRLVNPPAGVRELLEADHRSRVDLALQWIWDQPEVSVVLSGMSDMAQVQANLESAGRAHVGSLGAAEHALIRQLQEKYRERTAIPCTHCGYCMPCPTGVDIPRNFQLYNDAYLHDDSSIPRFVYGTFFPEPERASACAACHACEELCPQQIPISEWMPKIDAFLGVPKI